MSVWKKKRILFLSLSLDFHMISSVSVLGSVAVGGLFLFVLLWIQRLSGQKAAPSNLFLIEKAGADGKLASKLVAKQSLKSLWRRLERRLQQQQQQQQQQSAAAASENADSSKTVEKQAAAEPLRVHRVDAVVIGSGIGGLTTAALLAKAGKVVWVLEQVNERLVLVLVLVLSLMMVVGLRSG
jgi:hypothetical protein